MEGKEDVKPTNEIIHMAIRHLNLLCDIKGEEVGVKEMKENILPGI